MNKLWSFYLSSIDNYGCSKVVGIEDGNDIFKIELKCNQYMSP